MAFVGPRDSRDHLTRVLDKIVQVSNTFRERIAPRPRPFFSFSLWLAQVLLTSLRSRSAWCSYLHSSLKLSPWKALGKPTELPSCWLGTFLPATSEHSRLAVPIAFQRKVYFSNSRSLDAWDRNGDWGTLFSFVEVLRRGEPIRTHQIA